MQNKNGLLLITKRPGTNYLGFDGKASWPYTELKPNGESFLRRGNNDIYSTLLKVNSKFIKVDNGLVSTDHIRDVLLYQKSLEQKSRLLYLQFSNR